MPVRKIPKNHLFVTGGFASRKNGVMGQFESLLEKEFMLLLDFDDTVESFEEQPVRIPLPTKGKFYVPDILIHYYPDPVSNETPMPYLSEIKHSDDLSKNHEKYAVKFDYAAKYAEQQGWRFGITTEKHIRTSRLANIKFLREYRNIAPRDADRDHVLNVLARMTESNIEGLVCNVIDKDEERLYWMPVIWHLVLTRQIQVDLNGSIDKDTKFCLPE